MDILFVDLDGVLNNCTHFLFLRQNALGSDSLREANIRAGIQDLDPWNCANLKYVFDTLPDLKIVLSTAWRDSFEMDEIQEMFERRNLPGSRIIGKTAREEMAGRAGVIRKYVAENKPKQYAVIDDKAVFVSTDPEYGRFLKTTPITGFTYGDAIALIKLFQPTFKPHAVMF